MIKTVYTPIKGGFEESYKERIYFDKIEEIKKYLQKKLSENGSHIELSQFKIEYYTYSENLKKDRYIIIFRDFRHNIRTPAGFIHYEIIN